MFSFGWGLFHTAVARFLKITIYIAFGLKIYKIKAGSEYVFLNSKNLPCSPEIEEKGNKMKKN